MLEHTRKNLDTRLGRLDEAEDEQSVRYQRAGLLGYIDALYDEQRLTPKEHFNERTSAERRGENRLAALGVFKLNAERKINEQ